jgi:hypothetical protein
MDSVLRIHLKELGVNEEWVWKPDGKPEKLDKQLGEATGKSAAGLNLPRESGAKA